VRWNTKVRPAVSGDAGDDLNGGGAGADDAHSLPGEPGHASAGIAAGVVVVHRLVWKACPVNSPSLGCPAVSACGGDRCRW